MFILCSLILEARENLFRDFWSPFSIPFVFFLSVTLFLKKIATDLRAVSDQTLGPSGFISQGGPAGPPPQTLAALAPRRRRLCRRAAPPRAAVRRTAGGSFFSFRPGFFRKTVQFFRGFCSFF